MRPLSLLSAICLSATICTGASAATFSTIFKFDADTAKNPHGTVFKDADGSLYGTSYFFGPGGHGVVFKLSPPTGQHIKWQYEILYSFTGKRDGAYPIGALIKDASGALIGTTLQGGTNNFGTIFRLIPPVEGKTVWKERVLYNFTQTDGYPNGDLLKDAAGNIYGTAPTAGPQNAGEVFRLQPPAAGQTAWMQSVLYIFAGDADGRSPNRNLVSDGTALYGTTSSGGTGNLGTVFQLVPPESGDGAWTRNTLHNFTGVPDGSAPHAGLIIKNGKLFGTTSAGGGMDYGAVFQVKPPKHEGAGWQESVIHSFTGGADGRLPYEGLTARRSGKIYGATVGGGGFSKFGFGTIFSLTPPEAGQTGWTEEILHGFDDHHDGNSPAQVFLDDSDTIYGVTQYGMHGNTGTVFQITP